METTMLNEALSAAINDIPVFPCNPLDKRPLTEHGHKDATTDLAVIKEWWERWPNAMLGVPTGAVSGFFVVDLDKNPAKGINGVSAFGQLAAANGGMPKTATQRTPRGGEHILFKMPPDRHVSNSAGKLGRGIDVRGDGGYIIAAPSANAEGKRYRWVAPLSELAEAPGWLLEKIGSASPPKERNSKEPAVPLDQKRAVIRTVDYLRNHAPHGLAGSLSDTAYRVAARCKDLAVSEDKSVDLMLEHWPCSPPMTRDDLAMRVRNAYRYGRGTPGESDPGADFSEKPLAPGHTTEWLERMNRRYAVTTHHNKVMVHEIIDDLELGHPCHRWINGDDLKLRHRSERVKVVQDDGKVKRVDLGTAWLDHPQRCQYDHEAFLPGREAPAGTLNLWGGWAVTPKRGDWSKMRAHIKDVICDGDATSFAYLINWMARLVQTPGEAGQVAIVLQGGEGTGKGSFVNYLAAAIGQHAMQISQPKHLVGSFNQHLRDKILVFADEAFFAGDRRERGPLYSLITEPVIQIEAKGVDAKKTRNVLHIIMATNEEWAVQAGEDARRFAVLRVSERHKQDIPYFNSLKTERDNGGAGAMLHDLLAHDLTEFNVFDIPRTEALAAQKLMSLTGTKAWLLDALHRGLIDGVEWTAVGAEVDKESAYQHYKTTARDRHEHKPQAVEWWARAIRSSLPGCVTETRPNGDKRRRRFIFLGLDQARAAFETTMGCSIAWETNVSPAPAEDAAPAERLFAA